jgi:hypothetical protein
VDADIMDMQMSPEELCIVQTSFVCVSVCLSRDDDVVVALSEDASSSDAEGTRARLSLLMDLIFEGNQRRASRALEISQPLLSMILSGSRSVTKKFLGKWSQHPRVNKEWLLTGSGEPLLRSCDKSQVIEFHVPIITTLKLLQEVERDNVEITREFDPDRIQVSATFEDEAEERYVWKKVIVELCRRGYVKFEGEAKDGEATKETEAAADPAAG